MAARLRYQTGADKKAADVIDRVAYPRVKIVAGSDGVSVGDVSATNPLPVELTFIIIKYGRK